MRRAVRCLRLTRCSPTPPQLLQPLVVEAAAATALVKVVALLLLLPLLLSRCKTCRRPVTATAPPRRPGMAATVPVETRARGASGPISPSEMCAPRTYSTVYRSVRAVHVHVHARGVCVRLDPRYRDGGTRYSLFSATANLNPTSTSTSAPALTTSPNHQPQPQPQPCAGAQLCAAVRASLPALPLRIDLATRA